MKAFSKKALHAGLVALVGVLTDIGAQLATGGVSLTRAVIVGLIIGGLSRVVGAVLAGMTTTPPDA